MKRIALLILAAALAGPVFSDGVKLQDGTFYQDTTTMSDGTYYLQLKETGVVEKNASSDGTITVDADPYHFRDYTPPSQPDGVIGAALDSHTVRLSYLASTDNVLVIGYQVYRNGHYLGFTTETSYTDTGLTPVTIYSYNVQAVDKSRNLSAMSDTVKVATLDATTQNNPPRFVTAPYVKYLSATTAVIAFSANKAVTASVDYGTSSSYGSSVSVGDYGVDQVVSLTGLTAGSRYHYRVQMTDYSGHGPIMSRDDSFYTQMGSDSSAPQYTDGPYTAYVSDRVAVIAFTTDEDAKGSVFYGRGGPSGSREDEPYYTTTHAVILDNLQPATQYSYQVSERDRAGNGPVVSRTRSFTTKREADHHAPEILGKPQVSYVSDVMAIVTWETDEFSDSVVRFGGSSGSYTRIATATQMAMHHVVVLTNLGAQTKYYFVVSSTDPGGNVSERSAEKWFTTEKKADTTGPRIKGVQIEAGSQTARINWDTDELSAGKILFGTHSGMYNQQIYEGVLVMEHSLTLLGLQGSSNYYFQIVETDPSGNQSLSKEYSFRTGGYDPGHGDEDDGHGWHGHHGYDDDNGNNDGNHGGNDNHGRGEGY